MAKPSNGAFLAWTMPGVERVIVVGPATEWKSTARHDGRT